MYEHVCTVHVCDAFSLFLRLQLVPLSCYNLLLPRYALVLELGPDARLVATLHDPEGRLTWAVSDVFQHRGRTYLGSTDLPFLPVLEGEEGEGEEEGGSS